MLVEEASRSTNETLRETLHQRIQLRTGGRLWWVLVELRGDQVVIHGSSPSYYVIQLALAAVREMLPEQPVELDIQVGFNRPEPAEDRDAEAETFSWRHDPAGNRRAPSPKAPPSRPVRVAI